MLRRKHKTFKPPWYLWFQEEKDPIGMVAVHQKHPISVNWMKGFWHTGDVNVHGKRENSGIRFKQPHSLRDDIA